MVILTAKQILSTNLIVLKVEDALNVLSLYNQLPQMIEIYEQLESTDTLKLDFLSNKKLVLDWATILLN